MTESYAMLHCECIGCHQPVAVNPNFAPSLRVNGKREPLCRSCAEQINRNRVAAGMAPCPIHPQAYEPCPESELKF